MKRVALLAGLLVLTFGCRGEKAPVQTVDPPLKETAKEEALRRSPAWWDSENHGKPLNTDINGVMCFRGNPQRNYVGEGPIPTGNLSVLWRHRVGGVPSGHWSGVGWTATEIQPGTLTACPIQNPPTACPGRVFHDRLQPARNSGRYAGATSGSSTFAGTSTLCAPSS